jgi:MFS family permease
MHSAQADDDAGSTEAGLWRTMTRRWAGCVPERRDPDNEKEKAETPLPGRAVCVLVLVQFAEAFQHAVLYPMVPFLVASLPGIAPADVGLYVGLLVASFSLGQLVSSYPWGVAAQRWGTRAVVVVGLSTSAGATVALGLCRVFAWAVAARCAAGLFNGVLGCVKTFVGRLTDASNQGRAMAMLAAASTVGGMLGPAVGGALAAPPAPPGSVLAQFPYLLPCIVTAVCLVVACAGAAAAMQEPELARLPAPAQSRNPCASDLARQPAPPRSELPAQSPSPCASLEMSALGRAEVGLAESRGGEEDSDTWPLLLLPLPTAVGVPAPAPATPQPAVFTSADRRTLALAVGMYGGVALAFVLVDEATPLLCREPVALGGLGLDALTIGVLGSIAAVLSMVYNLAVYPRLVRTHGLMVRPCPCTCTHTRRGKSVPTYLHVRIYIDTYPDAAWQDPATHTQRWLMGGAACFAASAAVVAGVDCAAVCGAAGGGARACCGRPAATHVGAHAPGQPAARRRRPQRLHQVRPPHRTWRVGPRPSARVSFA